MPIRENDQEGDRMSMPKLPTNGNRWILGLIISLLLQTICFAFLYGRLTANVDNLVRSTQDMQNSMREHMNSNNN